MKQSPSGEAKNSSPSQEFPRILWTPKVHYDIHKPPLNCPYPQPHQYRPFRILPNYYMNIHFDIFLPSTPRSFKQSLSLRSPNKTLCSPLLSPILAKYSVHPIHLIHLMLMITDHKARCYAIFSLTFYLVTLRPKYLLQHSILKHASQYERPSFTPIQNNRKDYISVYVNLYIFG